MIPASGARRSPGWFSCSLACFAGTPTPASPSRLGLLAALTGVILLSLAGCAPKTGPAALDIGQAQAFWSAFAEGSGEQPKSFTLNASLSFQSSQKSARLLVKFWGNLDRPLRLDLSTGMGQTFSLWREDSLGWIAVYPLSNQAFTHSDTKAALSKLGMPFPFGLKDLAALAVGRYGLIFPPAYKSVKKTAKGFEYTLPASSSVAVVTLDFEGKPIHLTGRGIEPWSVEMGEFTPAEPGRKPLAQKIQLTTPGGLQALFRVKKLDLGTAPMEAQLLDLPLPPKAKHILLDREGEFKAPELP
jgi:hypothetical protein